MDKKPAGEGLLAPPAALLPEDVLADILARVAPRGLAVARAVCTAWRAAVDGHRLLRADLLPLSVGGIFVNFRSHSFPEYFARPSSGPSVSGEMDDYLPLARTIVWGHCNGLLLLNVRDHGDYVVNPATPAWAPVPPPPPPPAFGAGVPPDIFSYLNRLVFDPTLSPDYEVVSVPHVKYFDVDSPLHPAVAGAEWPPPRCILRVFSSKTNGWEERSFVRQGGAEATILGMHHEVVQLPYSTYSRGALYAFCKAYFVMRISLTHNRYQVIKSPASYETRESIDLYLGKSKNGVYLASYHHGQDLLQVWVLDESCDQMEWLLTHKCRLLYNVLCQNCNHQPSGPWVLHDVNYNLFRDCFPDNIKDALIEEKYEWDSDNDNVLDNEDRAERRHYCGSLSILGFHPFKEVIFLNLSQKRGLAYHWKSSKVQDLGDMYPTEYEYFAEMWPDIDVSFPYTPCWTYVGGLTEVANLEAHGSPC